MVMARLEIGKGKVLELVEGCIASERYSFSKLGRSHKYKKSKQYVSLHHLKRMVVVANCSLCNFQGLIFLK